MAGIVVARPTAPAATAAPRVAGRSVAAAERCCCCTGETLTRRHSSANASISGRHELSELKRRGKLLSTRWHGRRAVADVFERDALGGTASRRSNAGRTEMTLIDGRRPASATSIRSKSEVAATTKSLAYELVPGALVRWSERRAKSDPEVPTAVLVHGILGSRKNWASFARRLAQEFPTWQFLLVDLRCHGDSSLIAKRGPHTVASAARDVLQLAGQLKLTPRVLIGHSFGGKVALSMVDQAAKPLARPVRVWMLDATPGRVRVGPDGEDRPEELIGALREMPMVIPTRRSVIDALSRKGFSSGIARWMTTNLQAVRGSDGGAGGFRWMFDLGGVAELYQSYEDTNLWPIVEGVPQGVHIDFLRAERSLHRWHHDDVERIRLAERIASREGAGVQMHVLEDAGHWVHTDNPDGLFRILASSFASKMSVS